VRTTSTSPFVQGSIAAVIFAVIWLLTGGDRGSGLVLGSLLVGAITTAVVFVVRASIATRDRR